MSGKLRGGGKGKVSNQLVSGGGGGTVQHGRVTHGNKNVDGCVVVKLCSGVLCEKMINLTTSRIVDTGIVLIISVQLQIILIELAGLWCDKCQNGRR